MIGQIISHYKILEKLGEGGMGVVYKAHDVKLDRFVALKFLPGNVVSTPEEIARFDREAKTISSLNHKNIATIYDIDEVEGQRFIVLEYLEGGTLEGKIRQQPLSVAEGLDYAIQIAEGLVHAHKKGLVHRDLKPANVILAEDDQVKIADFGLAKLRNATKVTQLGSTVGTAGYMSPEQALGEEADQRSDIFSVGVILYEMLTCELPFKGQNAAALLFEIVNTPHKPIRDIQAEIPTELQIVIDKALEKDVDKRYQRTDDLLEDLRAIRQQFSSRTGTITRVIRYVDTKKVLRVLVPGLVGIAVLVVVLAYVLTPSKTTSRDRKSVAVLPLKNLSDDKEQEYFSDGITEDIIAHLSKIADLRVIARTSAMEYKSSKKSMKEIAGELNVATILEGTIRKDGNQIRIVTSLVDPNTGENLWAETYDRDYTQIFAIQSDVAQRIAGALASRLTADEMKRVAKTSTKNTRAYELFLEAKYSKLKYESKEDIEKEIHLLEESLALDPRNAVVWSELAHTYTDISDAGYDEPSIAYKKAREAAERALSLDPECADAHRALGWIKRGYDWDWLGAEREFQNGLLLEPGNARTMLGLAVVEATLGNVQVAIRLLSRASELDPFNNAVLQWFASIYLHAGMLDEARSTYQKLQRRSPNRIGVHYNLSKVYLLEGKSDTALKEAEQEVDIAFRLTSLALVYDAMGQNLRANEMIGELISKFKSNAAYQVAEVYAHRGDNDHAFEWLERAYTQRDAGLTNVLVDPLMKNITGDPRYIPFLDKMKLPHPKAGG